MLNNLDLKSPWTKARVWCETLTNSSDSCRKPSNGELESPQKREHVGTVVSLTPSRYWVSCSNVQMLTCLSTDELKTRLIDGWTCQASLLHRAALLLWKHRLFIRTQPTFNQTWLTSSFTSTGSVCFVLAVTLQVPSGRSHDAWISRAAAGSDALVLMPQRQLYLL